MTFEIITLSVKGMGYYAKAFDGVDNIKENSSTSFKE